MKKKKTAHVGARSAGQIERLTKRLRNEFTRRHRAEEASRNNAEQFRLILENTLDLISLLDIQGDFVHVSRSFGDVLGYSSNELARTEFLSLVHPNDQRAVMTMLQRALFTTEGRTSEFRFKHKGGSWCSFESIACWTFDRKRNPTGAVVISRDISERIQQEASLRASEEKFRRLVENVPQGMYQSTPDGEFLTVNPALVRMLGYESEAALLSVNIQRDLTVNPDDRKQLLRKLDREDAVHNYELTLRRKDGKLLVVLLNSHAVRDTEGEVLYYEGSLNDIATPKLHPPDAAEPRTVSH